MNPGLPVLSLSERKRRNRALHAQDLAARRDRFECLPVMLQLEPTSRCNLSCPICARNYYDRERNPPTDMTREILGRVEPLLPDADTVVLGGYGEPLLAPLYWDALAAAKGAGCVVETITNGTLLSEEAAARLASAGLDRLVVSIDAASEGTMAELRGIGLRPVADNLMGLSEVKRRQRRVRPVVEVNFTANLRNVEELPALVDVAEGLGVARVRVQLQKAYTRAHQDRPLLRDLPRAEEAFGRAADRARAAGIELALPPLSGAVRECRQPLELLFIRAGGKVHGCCSAVFDNDRYSFPIGDLREASLAELWNAPPMRAYRRALFAGDESSLPAACRNCSFRVDDPTALYRFLDGAPQTREGEDA